MQIQQINRLASAFQQPVDETALRSQLQQVLPVESIYSVTELDAGLFNNTFRVITSVGSYILKVAPRPGSDVFYNERQLMRRERSIAPRLQSASPLIPEYLAFFMLGERDAFLQPEIAGRLWHDVMPTLDEVENTRLWQQLGSFAHSLHTVRGEQFGYPAPCDKHDHWSSFIIDNVAGLVADFERFGLMCEEVQTFKDRLPGFRQILDKLETPRLCHGDLWPRNVIIDGSGTNIAIKAVFDAERAYWGDPVSDWVLILYGVPGAFWQGYGNNLLQSTDPVRVAIYRGMYFIVNILETTRFEQSSLEFRQHLSAINTELARHA